MAFGLLEMVSTTFKVACGLIQSKFLMCHSFRQTRVLLLRCLNPAKPAPPVAGPPWLFKAVTEEEEELPEARQVIADFEGDTAIIPPRKKKFQDYNLPSEKDIPDL